VYANSYTLLGSVKPFFGAGVGYQWTNFRFGGSDSQGVWGLSAGVEIPAGALTITPRIVYADDFEDSFNSTQEWTYEAEVNYWFAPTKSVFATLGFTDVKSSPVEAWSYDVGFRFKF
jgi:hypothetical protein